MSKPRLLDLFCKAGGSARGYQRAGFYVVGVDHEEQPRYAGDEFVRGDALEALSTLLDGGRIGPQVADFTGMWDDFGLAEFAAIHASPPCQLHTSLRGWGGTRDVIDRADAIPDTRQLLQLTGLPYVIENVERAPLESPIRVCGQGLGLRVRRHRHFESNVALAGIACDHPEPAFIVVRGSIGRKVFDPRRRAIAPTLAEARKAMEMPWARADELADAVPPAYTELIGHQLMQHITTHTKGSLTG